MIVCYKFVIHLTSFKISMGHFDDYHPLKSTNLQIRDQGALVSLFFFISKNHRRERMKGLRLTSPPVGSPPPPEWLPLAMDGRMAWWWSSPISLFLFCFFVYGWNSTKVEEGDDRCYCPHPRPKRSPPPRMATGSIGKEERGLCDRDLSTTSLSSSFHIFFEVWSLKRS